MNTVTPLIREFFDRYARSRSVQDINLIASQYPDSFMVAGPKGAPQACEQVASADTAISSGYHPYPWT